MFIYLIIPSLDFLSILIQLQIGSSTSAGCGLHLSGYAQQSPPPTQVGGTTKFAFCLRTSSLSKAFVSSHNHCEDYLHLIDLTSSTSGGFAENVIYLVTYSLMIMVLSIIIIGCKISRIIILLHISPVTLGV